MRISGSTSDVSGQPAPIRIPVDGVVLDGDLGIPADASGVVVFAHGSGSSRHSSRNREVAATLRSAGLATLLMDLLTPEEEATDAVDRSLRFDIALLADRVVGAVDWLHVHERARHLPIGCFGASTGAAAALVGAARRPDAVRAVVSRGGRPDLAGGSLPGVRAPTLLIVGGADDAVLRLNRDAMAKMHADVVLEIVPGASHLFGEQGALEAVARLATEFLAARLGAERPEPDSPAGAP